MKTDVNALVAELKEMTVADLRGRYLQAFGESSHSTNKQFLIKRIAWRVQAIEQGGLSERARRRAAELAADTDLRLTAPKRPNVVGTTVVGDIPSDPRLPMIGASLTREYRGRTYTVRVIDGGFEWEGETFRTLSAAARRITGSHWNGFLFFGLNKESKSS